MADWQDMGDGYVRNPAGLEVPREMVPPTDRIMPPRGAAPVAAPAPVAGAPAPAAPGAPMAPLTAASTLAKLDDPRVAAVRGQPQLPIAQQTETTQSAVPMSTLKPVMDRGMARADTQAASAVNLGEARAQTIEKQADAQTYAAQGQQAVSLAEQEDARQRADIARQNQIAIAAQEDPEIDPSRFISSMSTGQSIGTVILAAIEGAFRGMTGQAGQSGVAQILERRIDQDIMAQKEQIASGRIRRGNMISYFREQGMSEDAAEKAAKAMAYAQAEKLTQAEIARQGAGTTRAEGAALAEQIKAAREQANDELVLTLGTPRSTTTTVRAPAATGGDGLGDFTKKLAARKAYEESGATPEELKAFDATLGIPTPGGKSVAALDREGKASAAAKPSAEQEKKQGQLSSLSNLATQLDSLPDDTHSRSTEFVGKRAAKGTADFVFGEGAGDVMMSDQEKANRQVFEQAVNNFASLQSQALGQGALAGEEFDRAKAAAYAMGPKELARAIRSFTTTVGGKPAAGIQAEDR